MSNGCFASHTITKQYKICKIPRENERIGLEKYGGMAIIIVFEIMFI